MSFAQQWLFIYVDLMRAGLMSFYSFLKVAVELFGVNPSAQAQKSTSGITNNIQKTNQPFKK